MNISKRSIGYLALTVLVTLPTVVLAKLPPKTVNGEVRQRHQVNLNSNTAKSLLSKSADVKPGNTNANNSKPDSLPSLRRLRSLTPEQALQTHERMLQFHLDHLADVNFIPVDKKAEIEANLQAEINWLADYHQRAQSATTGVERTTLREELKNHITERQTNRQELIEQNLTLPDSTPAERAASMQAHFQTIITDLAETGIDTTALATTLADYKTAVNKLQNTFADLQTSHSIEQIQLLREQLQTVRLLGQTLRNQTQSIVVQLKSSAI